MKGVEDSKFSASDIAASIADAYTLSNVKVVRSQTSTGSEQITLDLGGRDKFNITITRARR